MISRGGHLTKAGAAILSLRAILNQDTKGYTSQIQLCHETFHRIMTDSWTVHEDSCGGSGSFSHLSHLRVLGLMYGKNWKRIQNSFKQK